MCVCVPRHRGSVGDRQATAKKKNGDAEDADQHVMLLLLLGVGVGRQQPWREQAHVQRATDGAQRQRRGTSTAPAPARIENKPS